MAALSHRLGLRTHSRGGRGACPTAPGHGRRGLARDRARGEGDPGAASRDPGVAGGDSGPEGSDSRATHSDPGPAGDDPVVEGPDRVPHGPPRAARASDADDA